MGNFFIFIWRLNAYIQFTEWIQYVLNVIAVLIAFFGLLSGNPAIFWASGILGSLLFLNLIFDICTVKLNLRPTDRLPRSNDHLNAFDLMRLRRSCRSFQSRNLTTSDLHELMECVRVQTQPTSLIGSCPIRFEYVAAPLTVFPVVGGHEFLVAVAPSKYNRLSVIDVGRSLQKVVIHATRMGIAMCWIGPGADHGSIVKHLGDRFNAEEDHIICVCAVGYASWFLPLSIRLAQVWEHRRLPIASLFFSDPHFREPVDVDAPPFNRFGRCYEVCQWSPSAFNAQPTRCVTVVEEDGDGKEHVVTSVPQLNHVSMRQWHWASGAQIGKWVVTTWAFKDSFPF